MKPAYKCASSECLKPFEKPFIRGNRQSKNWHKTRKKYMKKVVSLYYEELKEKYLKQEYLLIQKYLSMEETLVLCKKCHYCIKNRYKVKHFF